MNLVSISGPPASGKSTLWNQLRTAVVDVDFVPDLPRAALQVLDPRLKAWTDQGFQHYVGFAQLLREELPGDEVLRVCDKSLIDATAYWRVLFGSSADLRWMTSLDAARYEVILLCDHHDVEPRGDSVSRLHIAERHALAAEISRVALASGSRVVRLAGSPETRLRQALGELNRLTAGLP